MLIAAMLLAALCAAAPSPRLGDRDAWHEACKLSGYSCYGLSPPYVVEAPLWALLGRYRMGDRYILINEALAGNLAYAVKVHEMTHYLQFKRKAWKFTKENSCRMEKEAFDVSNIVLRRLGETSRVSDWEVLKVFYGCP